LDWASGRFRNSQFAIRNSNEIVLEAMKEMRGPAWTRTVSDSAIRNPQSAIQDSQSAIRNSNSTYRFAQQSDLTILRSALSQEARSCLSTLLGSFCTKPEWILMGFETQAIVSVLALASPSEGSVPLEFFRLHGELDERLDCLPLFQVAVEKARMLGASELYYTIPENAADAALISKAQFREWRNVVRFETADAISPGAPRYRTALASNLGRTEVIALVEKASALSADSQINYCRQCLGCAADAEMTVKMLESTRYDPSWWRVALDPDGHAAGIIFPVIAFGEPTVGFVGVLPEHRGQNVASFLLREAWSAMKRDGCSILCAEADQQNTAMHRALTKSGFVRRWQKQEWRLEL
jgi:GNAT superfamily N-acetyltransferase